ncbi:MAG: transketolase family protein [Clostridia bacterium]|nr:transketolase family protein [Clostridia bacterium]
MQKKATRDAYGEALVELGGREPRLVVLDADLSKSTKTAVFGKHFPDRFFNVGISEQNLMATAAGLAISGLIPFASTFAIFATGRAWEQIRNTICYPALNVKIAASHAGLTVGEDGASHQALEDLALMRVLPNMTVLVPADAVEAYQAVAAAARLAGPVYIRLGRSAVPVIFGPDYRFEPGRVVPLREGRDVAVFATGTLVAPALEAAAELAREGVGAAVYNVSTLKPLDGDAVVRAARSCGAVVTAEEHQVAGGLGGAIAEVLAETWPVPIERVGVRDRFGQSGKADDLMAAYGLTAAGVADAVRRVLAHKRRG